MDERETTVDAQILGVSILLDPSSVKDRGYMSVVYGGC
jgi:hypothetical protein